MHLDVLERPVPVRPGTTTTPVRAPAGLVGQLFSFAVVGGLSTVAHLVVLALLSGTMPTQSANLAAFLLTAVANTAANRRLTFSVQGGAGAVRAQLQALVGLGLGLALTSGSLAVLDLLAPTASTTAELLLVLLANAAAGLLRFALLRSWVFPQGAARPA